MQNRTSYQVLTENEKTMLERLLEAEFPGRDQIRQQITKSVATVIDEYGSLRFDVRSDIKAPVTRRIPIEAETEDTDGVPIHLLLHVVEGKIAELEIYKDDGSPIRKMPAASKLRLIRVGQ